MKKRTTILTITIVFLTGCFHLNEIFELRTGIEHTRTSETDALYQNLFFLQGKKLLFGHHDSTLYGLSNGGWNDLKENKINSAIYDDYSDVKEVCGDYPAIFSWDLYILDYTGNNPASLGNDKVLKNRIINTYLRGGINTSCWHMSNPVNGKGAFTKDYPKADMSKIFTDNKIQQKLYEWIDYISFFINSLEADRDNDGIAEKIPVIFRPYHEMNGNWFWWGKKDLSPQQFKQLWKLTIDRMRSNGVENILIAYSPDSFISEAEYLRRYPGNDYVDILGHDNYSNFQFFPGRLERKLDMLVKIADRLHKPAAITEMGSSPVGGVPYTNWWTDYILRPFTTSQSRSKISYIVTWRNASPEHYYAPYKRHFSNENFIEFYKNDYTMFERELNKFDIYKFKEKK
ncbi:MAG: hypothetical protein JXR63_10415 [Spirochaetales bacterium]|nr:hypothetical protein [Spirochaetales bacterium]